MTLERALRPTTDRGADLTPLLRPRSIAILGASARRTAAGNVVIANLCEDGYAGDLIVVHRSAAAIDGVPAVAAIEDLPDDLDLAFVSLPSAAVIPALRELAARGCRSAVVPSVGMSHEDQHELATLAAEQPMRILGPNCMGLLNVTDRIPLWISHADIGRGPAGCTALVAQSGSACIFIIRAAPMVGFSKIISSGNELGVTADEYLSWLADDPATTSVGVVIESLRDVPGFVAAVGKLRRANKPIVAMKVGRSPGGMAATVAHTGALVGASRAYDALFAELDVPTVSDYDEMASVLECFGNEATRSSAGPRVAVVTISGGQAAMGADLAERCGTPLAELAPATVSRLREIVPDAEPNNPYDIGASLIAGRSAYAESLGVIAGDPGVDTVIPVLDAASTLTHDEVAFSREFFEAVAEAAAHAPPAPLVVASSSSLAIHRLAHEWVGGVPILRGIHNALIAAQALPRNQAPVSRAPDRPLSAPDHRTLREALRADGGAVSHELGRALLDAYGVSLVPSTVVTGERGAAEAAAELGYPVVVKLVSPDVAHRSDIGGVITGITDADGVRAAVREISARVAHERPAAVIEGFEVQPHVAGSLEAMLGLVADPVFGATMSVGSGGTLVELLDDVSLAAAPLNRESARRAIGQTLLARLASGYRNLVPVTDLEPLAEMLEALSWLAADLVDVLAEVDLNPVLVEPTTGRVAVADALFVTHHATRREGRRR